MNRRHFLKLAGITAGASIVTGCGVSAIADENKAKKPNFVFFLVDDLGYKDLGCYGSTFYETPNIDRLAAEGMRFTDGYAACPVCSPTRAAIMTGKFPARMDTTDYFGAPQPDAVGNHWTKNKPLLPAPYLEHLPLEEVTLAEALKEAGYKTFFAGKWHLGETDQYWPEYQGFDINKGGYSSGSPRGKISDTEGGYFPPYDNPRLEDGPKGEHLPDRLATETVKFIEANKANPFIAYFAFYSVHTPLMSRPDLKEKYEKKRKALGLKAEFGEEGERKVRLVQEHAVYAGMVEAMDSAVGKVLTRLKELGLDKNTVIFFTSDNGGLSTSEGSPTSNLPLRAGKGWLYEGGIREAYIVKWPGVAKPGSVCSSLANSVDFYPTMLDIAGLPLRPQQHKDGVSLVPALKGQPMTRGPIFWHYPHYGNQGGFPGGAVRDGDWKLIENYETGEIELYNLKDDIGEKNNLARQHPDITNKLQQSLAAFRKEANAKMPSPNPNFKKA